MGVFDFLKSVGEAIVEKAQEQQFQQMEQASGKYYSSNKSESKIAGRTLSSWETAWQYHGRLDSNLSSLNGFVGLYRARLGGEVVYIGRAVEYDNGGLRKRLSDYTRKSSSSRKHGSGQLMNANADNLEIEVLLTGSDEAASDAARKLEVYFVGKFKPKWNKMLK